MLFKAELVGGSPWGFRLEDGLAAEDGGHDRPVKIAKMNGNSKAHSQGVQVGDIVHRVNAQLVTGMSSSQVMQIVRNAGDVLLLELIRGHPSTSQGDDVSSGISSSDSLFHVSQSSTLSVNHDTNSSSRSSISSPFADKTNRLSTFGQKPVKSYRPVSFDVPTGDAMSREEENVHTKAPKSLFASEFTLDNSHDHRLNSESQKSITSNSGGTNLIENSTSSTNTVDNETSLNRWNVEKDRPHNSSAGSVSTRPTSHSMDFSYSTPSVSATSSTWNSHPSVSSLNVNISESLSRLPVVKNPTITLLQKKRAEGLLSRSLSSFGSESSDRGDSDTAPFASKPTSDLSSSDVRRTKESPLTDDRPNSMDRSKEWKDDRFLNKGNQMEERFSQSGITVLSMADDNYEKQDKYSNTARDSQNSTVRIFSNGNQSPSEASLQDEVQNHSQPGNRYAGPGVANSHISQVQSDKKYVKFEGVGPVDEKTGILIATRSSLDEKGQKDWYKQMYKSLHKSDKDSESIYVFPGDDDESSRTDRTRRKSTHGVTYTIRKATPDDKSNQRYASTPSLADAGLEDKPKTPGARNQRLPVPSVAVPSKGRQTSISRSPEKKLSDRSWTPAQYKYESQPYKVQPKRIEDYEPGQSSVLQREGHQAYSSVGNLYKDEVYIKPSRRSESIDDSNIHLDKRPFWKSTSELDQQSLGQVHRDSKQQKPANETKQYNSNGSTTTTFKTSAPVNKVNGDNWGRGTNGFRTYQSNERNGSQESNSRQPSSYISTSALSSLGTRDLPSATTQRHDFKVQNSHQGDNRVSAVQPTVRSDVTHSDVTHPISLAKATHSFRAQSPSDLSFHEGDAIYIFDKIDDNWYKGECNGKVGKFPINFVERQNSAEGEYLPETQVFGRGRALYDFTAQTLLELSFKKNDELALISRINKDWFEACIGKRKGFAPANYVDVIQEPSSLSSPKKVLSPQETTRPSLISTSSLSTSNLTMSPVVHQNMTQRQNSGFNSGSFNGSHRPLEKNVTHQRGGSMGSDMQNRNSTQAPSHENKSFANHQSANRSSHSDMSTRASFRSADHLNSDHLRPASAFVNGPGKTSHLVHNVASQPIQRSYDVRAPVSVGTNAGGTKVTPVKTATVWPTHKTSGVDKVQALNSQNFGKSKHIALFAYNPRRADELELNKGDIVYVMEQYDDGWFVGMSERTKKLGTFPGNYVEALWKRF